MSWMCRPDSASTGLEAILLVGVNTTAGRTLDVVFLDGACTIEGSSGSMVCNNGVFVLIVGEA
jgi:hypothetical protein